MNGEAFRAYQIRRHRLTTDGAGVTTLVAAVGCPLRCAHCLNPGTLVPDAAYTEYTPESLMEALMPDDLYFQATGGGATFGGGEPLLFAPCIRAFCALCAGRWAVNVETSLNVPAECVFLPVDQYIVDIKDMNPDVYRAYTGTDNARVIANLTALAEAGLSDRVRVRVPLIPGFNTDDDRQNSVRALTRMGFADFDLFTYRVK